MNDEKEKRRTKQYRQAIVYCGVYYFQYVPSSPSRLVRLAARPLRFVAIAILDVLVIVRSVNGQRHYQAIVILVIVIVNKLAYWYHLLRIQSPRLRR
jgi:hypothetical protein